MNTNNNKREVIFEETANNTSSFTITPPQTTSNLLIVMSALTSTVASASEFLIVQTAPSSGVFDTTGYITSAKYSQSTTNAWTNESIATGLMISADYGLSGENYNGYAYIMNLNTSQRAASVGVVTAIQPGPNSFFVSTAGTSPTTSATMIRIKLVLGLMASGTITIYSLF